MAHDTGQTAVRRMYRRLVTLSRMLHDHGVGHGTPFVLSTPLARPLGEGLKRTTGGGDGGVKMNDGRNAGLAAEHAWLGYRCG